MLCPLVIVISSTYQPIYSCDICFSRISFDMIENIIAILLELFYVFSCEYKFHEIVI